MEIPFARTALDLFGRIRFPVRYPPVALEVDSHAVTAVRLKRERGGHRLAGFGISALPPTVGVPTPASPRVGSPEDLHRAVDAAIERAGIRPGRASLLLPDNIARVWLLQLPELPRGHQMMLEMIRWKIKKSLPFRVEDCAISWHVLSRPSGVEPAVVLTSLIPRAIIAHYESLLGASGLKIGLVDLASFNLCNSYRHAIGSNGATASDFAVLNLADAYFTLILFRKGDLVFYRCKTHAESEGESEDRVRAFRRELATSLSYYTEKLKGAGLAKTFVRAADPALAEAGEILRTLSFGEIEPIDPSRVAALPGEIDERTALRLVPAMGAAAGRAS